MRDKRSRRCVFTSHCVLAQGVMAEGIVRTHAASVRPVIEFCLRHEINIFQMPCPETLCAAGGLGRSPHGKAWYERNGLREISREIALGQAGYMAKLRDGGMTILGVIGVEFSPACAVSYLNKGPAIVKDQGIYVEELRVELARLGIEVPFIGISQRWSKKMLTDLNTLIAEPQEQPGLPGMSSTLDEF